MDTHRFATAVILILALRSSAAKLPTVTQVEGQPLAAQAQRISDGVDFLGSPLPVVDMAGARLGELLRLPPRHLEPGAPVDVVLFDWEPGSDFRVVTTVVSGRTVPAATAS
jgi:hypothetical protein